MKLQPDKSSAPLVKALGPGWIQVDAIRHEQSLVLSSLPEHPPAPWHVLAPQELQNADLTFLTRLPVELVILGTGLRQHRPPMQWLAGFASHGVGLEWMDTAAACRTYNILASEGRKVAAALLIEPESTRHGASPITS